MNDIESILKSHLSPVLDDSGKVIYYCYIKTDFSDLIEDIEKLYKNNMSVRTVDDFISDLEFLKKKNFLDYFIENNKESVEKLKGLL